jgi:hypothetical protein
MYDEVWDGEYHMAPMAHSSHGRLQAEVISLLTPLASTAGLVMTGPFNLGVPSDFRVPDLGLHRDDPDAVWVPNAVLVGEIESADDETWEKLSFYASLGVEEVVVVSAERRSVTWLILEAGDYARSAGSALLGPESASLVDWIKWPGIQRTQ